MAKYDVFISYSSLDQKVAEGVCGYLESHGCRCFVAYRDIPRGMVWARAIVEAIDHSQTMVVVFSEHFNISEETDREIELAAKKKMPILTFRITESEFTGAKKYYLENLNWIDAFPKPDVCFGRLYESVSSLLMLPDDGRFEKSAVKKDNPAVPVSTSSNPNLKIKCDLDCVFYLDREERMQLTAGKLQKIPLSPGEYELAFVGTENSDDRIVQDFRMPQEDKLLKVSLKEIRDKRLEKEAEVKRIAEEKRLAEENRREEEKRRAEEEARKRAEEEKRREEDRKRAKEQERREEDRKRAEEVKRREEERRRAEEEARKWAEEEAKKYEEARKRAEEEFRRKVDEERRFATSDCEFTVNGVSFKMINVEGGTFQMGATPEQGNFGWDAEKPVHSVTLSSYRIGDTPVTQALWKAVMGNNPSLFKGDNLPVEKVSWDDCQEFIQKLNRLTGKTFRLLTEAEWEYAARGGKHHSPYKYAGSNNINEVAWYDDNSGRETHPVKTKKPNALGIYDMSGNVREWCQDCFEHYSGSAQTDPKGPTSGSHRVLRGGSWNSGNSLCQVASRSLDTNGNRIINSGFRLAL